MRKVLLALGILLIGSTANAQDYRIGESRRIAWDYPGDVALIVEFRVTIDNGATVNVGMPALPPSSFVWPLPTLPIGDHRISIVACNAQIECSQTPGTLGWKVLSPIPTTPFNLRLIAAATPITPLQAGEMAESYAYLVRLERLKTQEKNALTASFPGPLTYGATFAFLDSIAITFAKK